MRAASQSTAVAGASTLNFFIDFPQEAARNDVTLPAGRVFFTGALWDQQDALPPGILDGGIDMPNGQRAGVLQQGPGGVYLLDQGGCTIKRNDWRNLCAPCCWATACAWSHARTWMHLHLRMHMRMPTRRMSRGRRWGTLGDVMLILGRFSFAEQVPSTCTCTMHMPISTHMDMHMGVHAHPNGCACTCTCKCICTGAGEEGGRDPAGEGSEGACRGRCAGAALLRSDLLSIECWMRAGLRCWRRGGGKARVNARDTAARQLGCKCNELVHRTVHARRVMLTSICSSRIDDRDESIQYM